VTVPERAAALRRRSVAQAGHARGAARRDARRTAREGLDDPEPAVRTAALGALDRLGELRLEDLMAAATDEAPRVRMRAAELAHRFGPAAGSLLVTGLEDPRHDVVEAACFGLGELGADAPEAAVPALARVAGDHPDALCREAAVAALGGIGPVGTGVETGRDAILRSLADKPAVRRRAVLALASFDGPEVEAALQTALADRDWQVRQAAEDLTGDRRSG
jgi:HEAT repeat protein